jgi:hypothetical protein
MRAEVNLSSEERGSRLQSAVWGLAISMALVIGLAELGTSLIWWVALAIPLFATSLQVVQADTGVCVFHAHSGTRLTEDGEVEEVLDPRMRSCIRARGRAVLGAAAGMAGSATGLVIAVASLR